MPREKIRLDDLLVSRGLAESLKKAESLILSGSVLVDERVVTKTGLKFYAESVIRIKEVIRDYASRGARKLLPILEKWEIDVMGRDCIDLGASTGGFTDVLLRRDAKSILSVDIGYGQLIERLRKNSRVTVLDRFHVNELKWENLGTGGDFLIVMDLSFISLLSVFPTIFRLQREKENSRFEVLSLVKPQFEINPEKLERGIVRDRNLRFFVLKKVLRGIRKEGGVVLHLGESPIQGTEGNVEFFVHWECGKALG